MNTGYATVGSGNIPEWVLIHYWVTAWGDEWQAQEDWLAETSRLEDFVKAVEDMTLAAIPKGMMN